MPQCLEIKRDDYHNFSRAAGAPRTAHFAQRHASERARSSKKQYYRFLMSRLVICGRVCGAQLDNLTTFWSRDSKGKEWSAVSARVGRWARLGRVASRDTSYTSRTLTKAAF